MSGLSDISFWSMNLGHLPIQLSINEVGKYIMLNGISGNFCIQVSDKENDRDTYFSESWSSNTKNYLLVQEDKIKLFNWSKDVKEETISSKSIQENAEKFYKYLISKSQKTNKDVVPFVIDIFRQFRNYTAESQSPTHALNLLFLLLASLEDGNPESINRTKWGLGPIDIPNDFDQYVERFNSGVGEIAPRLDLILRHSSGALFQEAQKEVVFFSSQMDLFGTFSDPLITKELLYSSIHYTPSFLARSIVENSLRLLDLNNKKELRILDPACGSAEFLVEVLKQLKERKYSGSVTIDGYDNSETAVNTSNFLLSYEKRKSWNDKLSFSIKLVDDSLTENWKEGYDLILMNPPFVSWQLLEGDDQRDAVKTTLKTCFQGRPNLASAFFYKSVLHLGSDGILGSVVPSSLFTHDAYSELRKNVEDLITFNLIGKLGNFVFEDALTDASIIIGNKVNSNDNSHTPTLLWTRNEKNVVHDALRELRKLQYLNKESIEKVDYTIFRPNYFPIMPDSWRPVSISDHKLIQDLKIFTSLGKLTTIGDVFDVRQGIRTGNNEAFKVTASYYQQLPENEQSYFRPVTENESILNGQITINTFVWYPYDKNGPIITTEVELQDKAPEVFRKIFNNKREVLINRARKDISNWWLLSEHRAWQRSPSIKIISTEFGNSTSFALDTKGNLVVERGYGWIPKKKFEKDDYFFYLALFSSSIFEKLLSVYSRQLLAAWDLGKKYTKEIPIPDIHKDEVKESSAYSKIVELGKRLSSGDDFVKSIINDYLVYYYPLNE